MPCGRVAIGVGKGVIESAFNDFWRAFRRRHASVRRRSSCGAGLQGRPLNHAVNALVTVLMRRPILLVFFQVRPSAHRSIEDGTRGPCRGNRIGHGGHRGEQAGSSAACRALCARRKGSRRRVRKSRTLEGAWGRMYASSVRPYLTERRVCDLRVCALHMRGSSPRAKHVTGRRGNPIGHNRTRMLPAFEALRFHVHVHVHRQLHASPPSSPA